MSNIKHHLDERDDLEAIKAEKIGGSRDRGHIDKENLMMSSEQWPEHQTRNDQAPGVSLKKFHDLTFTEKQRPENNPFLEENSNY